MDEKRIAQALKHDFSAGTEAFRDELLQRCLDVLGSDVNAAPAPDEVVDLPDEALELLSAAGDPYVLPPDAQ